MPMAVTDETTKWTQWHEELVAQRLKKERAVAKWLGGEERGTYFAATLGFPFGLSDHWLS